MKLKNVLEIEICYLLGSIYIICTSKDFKARNITVNTTVIGWLSHKNKNRTDANA